MQLPHVIQRSSAVTTAKTGKKEGNFHLSDLDLYLSVTRARSDNIGMIIPTKLTGLRVSASKPKKAT